MKKIKKLFLKYYLLIFSFIFSLFLWTLAKDSYEPIIKETFTINLTLESIETLEKYNYVLANKDELSKKNITIGIQANKNYIDMLNDRKHEIKAYVDLSPAASFLTYEDSEKLVLKVKIRLPVLDNSFIYYQSEENVTITLDKLVTVTKEVSVTKKNKQKDGYLDSDPTVEPAHIVLKGPKTLMDTLPDKITVEVDINDADKDIVKEVPVKIYDRNSNDVTSKIEDISDSSVIVKVPIYNYQQVNILNPKYEGNPASGYVLADVLYEPKSINVIGSKENIDNLGDIELDAQFNIEGRTENLEKTVNLTEILDEYNLKLTYESQSNVNVQFIIEPIYRKNFTIPASQIKITGNESPIDFDQTQIIEVFVEGVESQIESIDQNDIKLSINLTDLGSGLYTLEPTVFLPDIGGINLEKNPTPIEIEIY